MKEGQPGVALLVSNADFKSGVISTVTHSSVTPLPHPVKTVLAQEAASSLVQDSADFINLMQRIFAIAASSLDLNWVLTRIAAVVGETFQVEGCIIGLPELAQLGGQTACWFAEEQTLSIQFPNLSAIYEPCNSPQSTAITDLEALSPGTINQSTQTLVEIWNSIKACSSSARPIRAILGAVAQLQEGVGGMISLMRSYPHEWTQAEKEGLGLVSHQIAIALFQHQLQRNLNQQHQHQQVVNQLTMAIRNSSDLHEILTMATDGTAQVLQVQRGLLLRLKYWDPLFRSRSQEQIPRVRASVTCEWLSDVAQSSANRWQSRNFEHSIPPLSVLNQSFWMSDCELCQQAFLHPSSPIVINNREQLSSSPFANLASLFNLDELPALLLAPLESQGTVLGFLVLQHDRPHHWQAEELELVELVSAQVSTAIIQTETLRQVQALVDKRTAELRESLSVQAKLYERTRQQLDQLRHLNQLKDEFLSTVSHELRTPLTSMTVAIRMLRHVGVSNDRSTIYLDILEQQCTQETNLINDLLALQELESNQLPIQLQEINIDNLVRETVASFSSKWSAKGLTLELDLPQKPLKVRSDRDSLTRILLELMTNAGKYSEPNGHITLKLSTQALNEVTLSLCNTGPGISPEELPYIFDRFTRCQGATQNAIQGTGLGLALVKCLVQHLNGSITASSCATNNTQSCETCFTLTLPQFFDSSRL